jgi:hypothetical protein
VPEKEGGDTYLRPTTGTGMPSKERFRRAPMGARLERCPLIEISRFVVNSSRSYAKWFLLNVYSIIVLFFFSGENSRNALAGQRLN